MNKKWKRKKRGAASRLMALALSGICLFGSIPSIGTVTMADETLTLTTLTEETNSGEDATEASETSTTEYTTTEVPETVPVVNEEITETTMETEEVPVTDEQPTETTEQLTEATEPETGDTEATEPVEETDPPETVPAADEEKVEVPVETTEPPMEDGTEPAEETETGDPVAETETEATTPGTEESTESETSPYFECEKTVAGLGYVVRVRYDETAGIPKDAILSVEELTGFDYDSCMEIMEATLEENETFETARFFDIGFQYNDQKLQLAAGSEIDVSIEFTDDTALNDSGELDVVRLENGIVNVIRPLEVNGKTVSFKADRVSTFGVTVIQKIALSTLLLGEDPESEETITVTFRLDNENYTNDPGSGETHLTVSAPIEGGELTYTKWTSSAYKVTGTGVICSCTIPSETSLADNGQSAPDLSVTNIGQSNTYEYVSPRSWLTEDGTICNVNTVFNQDTTLYLSLYESSSEYFYLDFVCCEEDNESISAKLSGYPSATFSLGQSVSEQYIPSIADVQASYSSDHHPVNFLGWQLKNTATGEMVDFTAGVPITADYVKEEYGNVIKVYAKWEAVPVTATFLNGEETVEERPLSKGDALGELPDMTEYMTGEQAFLGWQYTDSEENLRYATAETVILEDTTYTAVFGEEYYDVVFHDIQPNGEEAEITIDLSVKGGSILSEVLALPDVTLADGKLLSQCNWYTVTENAEKEKIDINAAVTGDMDLYTYTYQIQLTLSPEDTEAVSMALALVEVEKDSDGGISMTITARDGETLSASDFVIDGVDYSLYNWTTEEGQELTVQELITNGVTENITATSDGTLASGATTATGTIQFYVSIDNKWTLLTTKTMTGYFNSENNSYYLSAGQLESIYGSFGFRSSDLTVDGRRLFGHEVPGGTNIYGDRSAIEFSDGFIYSPILRNSVSCKVYYLPNASSQNYSGSSDSFAEANTFYTVTVQDLAGKVYTADTLPGVIYALTGTDAEVTVLNAEGVTWQCVNEDGTSTIEGTQNDGGTTTFTITNISEPYVISPILQEDESMINYEINLPETPSDMEYGNPTIEGKSSYSVVETSTHIVLAPSLNSYFYKSEKYLGEATFIGWAVNGDTTEANLLQPGEILDLTAYGGRTVTLTAQWTTELGGTSGKLGSMVNFFVSLGAMPEGTTSWTGSTEASTFTQSVYTMDCGVDGTTAVRQHLYASTNSSGTQYFVLGGTSGTNLNDNHTTIVNSLTAGYTLRGTDRDYTYTGTFPTDEEVLQTVRQMVANGTVITINGHTITPDELITQNFTIKWYVFKYDDSDGWHIDGILIAKTGKMVVTKTFAGDQDAINSVKANYSISVTGGAVNTGGTLSLTNASGSENTYTWTVDVDQYYNYTVSENNYVYSGNALTTTTARYNIQNSAAQNTGGWLPYSSGVTVTGQGYNEKDSGRLTVSFLNTYTAAGTLILQKVDAATGNLMPNVSFTIAKEGAADFGVYNTGGSHYTADPSGQSGETTQTITTDSTGQAYLYIGGGIYTFVEAVPTGYDDPGVIRVELQGEANNSYKVVAITSCSAKNGSEFVGKNDSLELIVKNYSHTVDLVVEKIWEDNENKPVTLQLYRGGESLGDKYKVDLNGSENWTHTFENMPLYADGGLAQYTIREEALGDFRYSEEYSDGYRYYDVTYSGMLYLDENGSTTSNMQDVTTIRLNVTNKRSTGELTIRKVDENGDALAGAEFWLYPVSSSDETAPAYPVTKDSDGHNVLVGLTSNQSAVSDANGQVNFGRTVAAGRYYLIEHAAPENYEGSDDRYMLVFTGNETTMSRWNGTAWEAVSGNQVVNKVQTVDVTITKQVTGNMGDRSRSFNFTVTCDEAMGNGDGYTLSENNTKATFTLGHDETITLHNVKKGASLTIAESGADGYTMTVEVETETLISSNYTSSYTIPSDAVDSVDITVTNNKEGQPDTGVVLDSLPYIVILLIVVAGIILFLKKRKKNDDD